jgi:hypothetical protein
MLDYVRIPESARRYLSPVSADAPARDDRLATITGPT